MVRLLSLNIWDLPVGFPGHDRARRRARLLEALPAAGADVILIQEAFVPGFKLALARTLAGYSSDAFLEVRRRVRWLPMDGSGGLVTFSRIPIIRSHYQPFRSWSGMRPDERIGRKGVLWCELETAAGRILVGNTHLYAGCGAREARVRAMQTRGLLRQLDRLPPLPVVVAGDFNMCIEYENGGRSTGFERMEQAGFREVATGRSTDLVTMSPSRNGYARLAAGRWPERRLTQVFVRGIEPAGLPEVCLHEPPVSDHFGLTVPLTASPR